MLPALAAVNGKQQSPQPGRFQVPAGRGHFFAAGSPQRGHDGGKEAAAMACETRRLAAFCVPGRKAAGRAVRVPSRGSRKQQKKEEVLRFHKTSSLVRWKGLSRALADSPQDCPPRPGRKAAGRAVRVPSRGSRKQQKKKRFCVSTKPLLWCSGTFAIRTFVLFFTVERQFSLSLIHTSKMPHRSASSVYIDQNHNCYVLCTASPQE